MSKIWFVTGATRGIGREIARAALAAGDRVVVTGRRLDALHAAFDSHGDRVLPLTLDVADPAQAEAAVGEALKRFGRIDVLINNAGYGQLGAFEEIEPRAIEAQFATNVFGLFHVTRAVLPAMRAQRAGRIINVSSVAGVLGFKAASVYCASKFAIEGFSESLAQEVAAFGIHVTLVEPGFFRTDFLEDSSVHYGQRAVDDYTREGPTRATYDPYNQHQPGDPVKLGRAVVEIAAAAQPPMRFAAGSDALRFIGDALAARSRDLAQWRALSASTDGEF